MLNTNMSDELCKLTCTFFYFRVITCVAMK